MAHTIIIKKCECQNREKKQMNHWFFLLLSIIGGAGLAFQAGVNGELGKKIGTIEVGFLAYSVGTAALLLFTIFSGKGDPSAIFSFPKWKLFVGVLGALYIFITILSIPKIGAAPTIVAAIVGQVIMSLIIDHFGLFGTEEHPINFSRASGFFLLLFSLFLIFK